GVSVDFISPEQAEDPRVLDVRSELYSLGCVFYYLLTGQPPFPGGAAMERLHRHRTEPAPRVEQLRRDVPSHIADMVHCLLAKDPDERYARPRDVAAGLSAYAGHGDRSAVVASAVASETRVLRRPPPLLTATPVAMESAPVGLRQRWKSIVVACSI